MGRYILSNLAVEDLSGIWNYTFDTWSEKQADKYYAQLIAALESIAKNDQIGKPYPQIGESIRGRVIATQLILYRTGEPGVVEVLRILHQRMDLRGNVGEY